MKDMNRRRFIGTLASAAAILPTTCFGHFPSVPRRADLTYAHQPKLAADLLFGESEQALFAHLKSQGAPPRLFGGPVYAKLNGQEPRWLNLLVEGVDFGALKNSLFEFGVRPISTAELPTTFAKFLHGGKVYNLMCCQVDDFCRNNRLHLKTNLVPFAHNFMIYDVAKAHLIDPAGVLSRPGAQGRPEIVMLAQPRSVAEGLDCVLSGLFESHLLGLVPSEQYRQFAQFVLESRCPVEEAPRVVERVVNYMPDAIDVLGWKKSRDLVGSPMVAGVMDEALGVDIQGVCGKVAAHRKDLGNHFYGYLREALGTPRIATGFDDKLTVYLAQNGYAVRRTDVMGEMARA